MANDQYIKAGYLLQVVIMILLTVLGFMWKSMDAKLECIDNRLRSVEIQLASHCAKTSQNATESIFFGSSDPSGGFALKTPKISSYGD